MTFGKPRYRSDVNWELLRLVTLPGVYVVGGAQRLFKHFIRSHDGDIVSYCDRSKFTGNVYSTLGFTLSHCGEPSRVWSKGEDKITDNLLRQRGFDQLFGTNFGKGTSNENLMRDAGWRSVYDCGQDTFIFRR
jgi:hypothetical protein